MDYSSLLNDPVRSPKGSYTPLEELLLKLKVVSEINGRDRLHHNGRILKKFDDDNDNNSNNNSNNNNDNESMTFSDKEVDGMEVRTENMTENIMENVMENENGDKSENKCVNKTENENENQNENEKKNEFHGKSVNGGFKRTRSEDTYSATTTAPILMPSSPSSSTSTATSTSLKDYKRLNITKAFEILKNKLSIGKNQIFFLASHAYSFFSFFLFYWGT